MLEDVGVDSLFPLGASTKDLESDDGLAACVGDIRVDGV